MRKNVSEAGDLRFLLVADDEVLVAPAPELRLPVSRTSYLLGQVGIDIPHELGHPAGVLHVRQGMEVIGNKEKTNQLDRVHPFGPGQDTDDGLRDSGTRREQQAALDGAAGHLDEGPAFWDMTKFSRHARRRRKTPEKSLNFILSMSGYFSMGRPQTIR
jgi:hypothetical protein